MLLTTPPLDAAADDGFDDDADDDDGDNDVDGIRSIKISLIFFCTLFVFLVVNFCSCSVSDFLLLISLLCVCVCVLGCLQWKSFHYGLWLSLMSNSMNLIAFWCGIIIIAVVVMNLSTELIENGILNLCRYNPDETLMYILLRNIQNQGNSSRIYLKVSNFFFFYVGKGAIPLCYFFFLFKSPVSDALKLWFL